MVVVTPAQTFLTHGKSLKHKPDNISKDCRKSRGTTRRSTSGDRQSYYEDCHILQDGSRRTPGSACKGCLSNDYGLPARTLRTMGATYDGILVTKGIFLTTEDFCCYTFLLIYQIKGLRHPESNPKDSGNETRRLLDKPQAYPPDPLDGRVLFLRTSWGCRPIDDLIPGPRCEAQQHWKTGGKTYETKK